MAESTLTPLVVGHGPAITTAAPRIELAPDVIQMTALLPRPDGYELRILNASDEPQEARVRLQPQPADVRVVTLGDVERERLAPKGGLLRIPVKPWEIVTVRATR